MTCECANLDWSSVDQTAEHHPDCETRKPCSPTTIWTGITDSLKWRQSDDVLYFFDGTCVPLMPIAGWLKDNPIAAARVFSEYVTIQRVTGETIAYRIATKTFDGPTLPQAAEHPMWTASGGSAPITGTINGSYSIGLVGYRNASVSNYKQARTTYLSWSILPKGAGVTVAYGDKTATFTYEELASRLGLL